MEATKTYLATVGSTRCYERGADRVSAEPGKDIVMIREFSGRYHVHESDRSFTDVVAALEAAVGSVENEAFDHELSEVRDPSDFEARMHTHESLVSRPCAGCQCVTRSGNRPSRC